MIQSRSHVRNYESIFHVTGDKPSPPFSLYFDTLPFPSQLSTSSRVLPQDRNSLDLFRAPYVPPTVTHHHPEDRTYSPAQTIYSRLPYPTGLVLKF